MIRRALAWLLAGLVAFAAIFTAGRRNGVLAGQNKALRANDKAHERMNDAEADNGPDLSDADRRKRLLDLAKRLGD